LFASFRSEPTITILILVPEGMAKIGKKRKVKINDSYDGMIVGLSIIRPTVSRGRRGYPWHWHGADYGSPPHCILTASEVYGTPDAAE
jgi:hypothetical protein